MTSKYKELPEWEKYVLIIKRNVGPGDWKQSEKFYEKMFREFVKYPDGQIAAVAAATDAEAGMDKKQADCQSNYDIDPLGNPGAYMTTCLKKALQELLDIHGDKYSNHDKPVRTKDMINVELSEVNPGWLTNKLINKTRTIEYFDTDGKLERRLIVKNDDPEGFTPNIETLKLEYVLEQLYYDKLKPLTQEERYKDNRLVEIYARDLLNLLGWGDDGRAYKKLRTHLKILLHTFINSFNIYKYKDNEAVKPIDPEKDFSMISDLDFSYENEGGLNENKLKVRFALCVYFAKSLQAGRYALGNSHIIQQLEAPTEFFLGLLIERRRGKERKTDPIIINLKDFIIDSGIITQDHKEQRYNITTALKSLQEKEIIKGFEIKDNMLKIYP